MPAKKIWIVNFHTAPPEYTTQPRYLNLIPYLEEQGYEVTIISQGYLRNQKLTLIEKNKNYSIKRYGKYNYIHIKSIKHAGNGFRRMLAIFLFSLRLHFLRNNFDKPDIIYHNIHMPFDFLVYFTSKSLKAKYVVEAWDLWPEFFHLMGLIKKNNPFMKLAYQIEKYIYTKARKIVFTMEGSIVYIKNKRWDIENGGLINLNKINHITNGVDLERFNADLKDNIYEDNELDNSTIFKVLYVGSIRKANNLQLLIEAAEKIKSFTNIIIYIYGDGNERVALQDYCNSKNITNVKFKEKRIPFNYLPSLLSKGNLNILNYSKNFGIYGISSGKLAIYLASGKPIISNIKINYCVIDRKKLGISEDLLTSQDYADAILNIYNLSTPEYNEMCNRVVEASKEIDYKVLGPKFVNIFNEL